MYFILILTVVHAAVNAITNSSRSSLKCCTIYLTHYLDKDCARAIILSGISHVVYGMFTRWSREEKKEKIESAENLLNSAKVTCRYILIDVIIIYLILYIRHFSTKKEPQVTVGDSSKKISLSIRIKKTEKKSGKPEMNSDETEVKSKVMSGEPEKDLVITWGQFYMSLALLSAKKKGKYDKQPQYKVIT